MSVTVNGQEPKKAPVTIIVAAYHEVPNLPPGYYEVSRHKDETGTTTIRCWPQDRTRTTMPVER